MFWNNKHSPITATSFSQLISFSHSFSVFSQVEDDFLNGNLGLPVFLLTLWAKEIYFLGFSPLCCYIQVTWSLLGLVLLSVKWGNKRCIAHLYRFVDGVYEKMNTEIMFKNSCLSYLIGASWWFKW